MFKLIYFLSCLFYPVCTRLTKFFRNLTFRMEVQKRVLGMKQRETDIYLVTYPKSGTTWMQMILYQMISDGDLDKIAHLSLFAPHLEEDRSPVDKMADPRVFKTHLARNYFPIRKGKCIYVMRNGMDVAKSYYHHYQTFNRYSQPFADFFKQFMAGKVNYGSWFHHMVSWQKEKANPKVLFLRYEEMKQDLEGTIRKISNYCQLPLDEKQMPRILERSSFQYMKENQSKLDLSSLLLLKMGVEEGKMVRSGQMGEGTQALSQEERDLFQQKCREQGIKAY